MSATEVIAALQKRVEQARLAKGKAEFAMTEASGRLDEAKKAMKSVLGTDVAEEAFVILQDTQREAAQLINQITEALDKIEGK